MPTEKVTPDQIESTLQTMVNAISKSGPMVIFAVIVFFVGLYICKKLRRLTHQSLIKYNVDKAISNFVSYAVYIICVGSLSMTCLEMIGIQVSSFLSIFVAVFGAVALSLGLAFKEVLANLGSGMIILFFKPFKIGDYISGAGVEGTVSDIQLFGTILHTVDNKTIIVPHIKLTGDNVINYTTQEKRRIDFAFMVSYDSDIRLVKKVIENIFAVENRILDDPKPVIGLQELGESSLKIIARPWVKTNDYWPVYYDIMEKVKYEFDKNNIEIPFPSRTIYYGDK